MVVCLPTRLTYARSPDTRDIMRLAHLVALRQRADRLIILECRGYPGMTRELIQPILEERGMRAGIDFFLAYRAESPGSDVVRHTEPSRVSIIAGVEAQSLELASDFCNATGLGFRKASSVEVAEAAALLADEFRSVCAATVSELKIACAGMGINFREALNLGCSEGDELLMEFAEMPSTAPPSPAPFLLTWAARKTGMSTRMLELAGEVNSSMPAYYLRLDCRCLERSGQAVERQQGVDSRNCARL